MNTINVMVTNIMLKSGLVLTVLGSRANVIDYIDNAYGNRLTEFLAVNKDNTGMSPVSLRPADVVLVADERVHVTAASVPYPQAETLPRQKVEHIDSPEALATADPTTSKVEL